MIQPVEGFGTEGYFMAFGEGERLEQAEIPVLETRHGVEVLGLIRECAERRRRKDGTAVRVLGAEPEVIIRGAVGEALIAARQHGIAVDVPRLERSHADTGIVSVGAN